MRAEASPALWPPKAGREGGGGGCEHSGFSLCCWEVRMGCLPPGSDRHPPRWLPRGPRGDAPSCDRARRPSFLFLFRAVPASGRALLCEAGGRCWEGRGPGEPLPLARCPRCCCSFRAGDTPQEARPDSGSPPCPAGSDSHPPRWLPVVPLPGPTHPRDGPPPPGSCPGQQARP